MKRFGISLAVVALAALACSQSGPTGPTNSMANVGTPMFANAGNNGNGVVHHVSVGGHDADIAGHEDANFSLTAVEYGDGSVKGEWTDQFGQSDGGIHVAIDCLDVVGNQAWVSGTITSGNVNGVDVSGERALTRVADNGKSANDPPDAISFSFFPIAPQFDCHGRFQVILLPMTDGQVTVD